MRGHICCSADKFSQSMTRIRSNSRKSFLVTCRAASIDKSYPRLRAATCARASGAPPVGYLWVRAEAPPTRSERPASSSMERKTLSALGERQKLPVETKSTLYMRQECEGKPAIRQEVFTTGARQ